MTAHEEFQQRNWQTFKVGDRVVASGFETREAVITADLTYIGKSIGHLYGVHIYRPEQDGGDIDSEYLAGFLSPAPPQAP